MNLRILCFVDYYLPGYKAGGPLRTIDNMVKQFAGEFDFLIVTRNHDLSDKVSYQNVLVDKWSKVGHAKVFYASNTMFSFKGIMRIMKDTPHDVLYLNSFFSLFSTIFPLIIRRLGFYGSNPVIIAPRGEFSSGALAIKAIKKIFYIRIAKIAGIYSNLLWQASSRFEYEDIIRTFFANIKDSNVFLTSNVIIAPDLISVHNENVKVVLSDFNVRLPGPLRAVFLSRISPKKNLDYLLHALSKVNLVVTLSICGPIDDTIYWSLCQRIIKKLPSNVTVKYFGDVMHDQVAQTFRAHDVFIFPTRGENFGHVIFESLSAGTSVIVSDQTPWDSDPQGAVEVIGLEQPADWTAAINKWASFKEQDYYAQRIAAQRYMSTYINCNRAVVQNRTLFLSAIAER